MYIVVLYGYIEVLRVLLDVGGNLFVMDNGGG